ncbi:hypothetical protein CABS01_16589 [Colletotrichum abscissum]|uniref:uncharacterized protein n=1 Tax=Colletotrichum abscissum TaxID=1671311 RepID=UPI0027D5BAA4|nr:uncharacterized protein CABS01_16589 [Colletotrichum abscissum]KAK1519305.1 hypothetical protein CABS01_16589 [Colletotrichum abscissum]
MFNNVSILDLGPKMAVTVAVFHQVTYVGAAGAAAGHRASLGESNIRGSHTPSRGLSETTPTPRCPQLIREGAHFEEITTDCSPSQRRDDRLDSILGRKGADAAAIV